MQIIRLDQIIEKILDGELNTEDGKNIAGQDIRFKMKKSRSMFKF